MVGVSTHAHLARGSVMAGAFAFGTKPALSGVTLLVAAEADEDDEDDEKPLWRFGAAAG